MFLSAFFFLLSSFARMKSKFVLTLFSTPASISCVAKCIFWADCSCFQFFLCPANTEEQCFFPHWFTYACQCACICNALSRAPALYAISFQLVVWVVSLNLFRYVFWKFVCVCVCVFCYIFTLFPSLSLSHFFLFHCDSHLYACSIYIVCVVLPNAWTEYVIQCVYVE